MIRDIWRKIISAPLLLVAPAAIGQPADTVKDASRDMVEAHCAVCHGLDVVQAAHKSPAEWADTIQKMKDMGAELTDEEQGVILAYLERTQGPPQPAPAKPAP